VGIVKVLSQLGVLDERTRLAGISSGALTAGAVCSGLDEDKFHRLVDDMLSECRRSGCAGRMDALMRALLDANLPPDAAAKCNGRFTAGVTVMENGSPKPVFTGASHGGFKDRSDLIDTLAASAYIPM
jgi:hypothetical protein